MSVARILMCLLIGFWLTACERKGGSGVGNSTNLSVIVWSSFPPTTNSYRHIEHLQKLRQNANALLATNSIIFGQVQARGALVENSPLRSLLGIPSNEPATVSWSQSIDDRFITVQSSTSQQWFGRIRLNLKTGLIDSAHDVEALFFLSEIGRRIRKVVGTREEALRLFHGASSSPEREQATKAVSAALFLPLDTKLDVRMSAPGGSNGGYGHLKVYALSSNSWESLAYVGYPPDHGPLSIFGLSRPSYRFGGLRLEPTWTTLNTEGFLIDTEGFPYPKSP